MPLNPLADPNCPDCHGEGFNFTGEAFAPTQGDRCDCLRRGRAQRYAKLRLVAARIPPKFAGASIGGFHIRNESIVVYDEDRGEAMQRNLGVFDKANRDAVADLCAKPLPPGLTVFFKGPNGTGKTFLGNALLQSQILLHGKTGLFIKATRYFPAILPEGATPAEQRALKKLVRDVDVLFIDDLGAEKRSLFSRRELVDLIDDRWSAERPTIITSNESLREVLGVAVEEPPSGTEEHELWAHGMRIISRLGDLVIRIDWPPETPDYRGVSNREENEERKSAYRHSKTAAFDDSDRVAAERARVRFGGKPEDGGEDF